MKTSLYFFSFLFAVCFLQCKNTKQNYTLTGNITNDVNTLLSEGNFEVQIMDSIVQTPREQELSYRMQQAVEKNKKWYQHYLEQYREMRVLPYHPNFGLSQAEYRELMDMKLNINLQPSSTQTISITKAIGYIQFNTEDKIPYLESLKIYAKENIILIDNYVLHFSDTLFVANENHGLKSMWKGYTWRYDEPAENDTVSDDLNAKHYSITIGQLYKTGNTLLIISRREDTDGENTMKLDKPLVLIKK